MVDQLKTTVDGWSCTDDTEASQVTLVPLSWVFLCHKSINTTQIAFVSINSHAQLKYPWSLWFFSNGKIDWVAPRTTTPTRHQNVSALWRQGRVWYGITLDWLPHKGQDRTYRNVTAISRHSNDNNDKCPPGRSWLYLSQGSRGCIIPSICVMKTDSDY